MHGHSPADHPSLGQCRHSIKTALCCSRKSLRTGLVYHRVCWRMWHVSGRHGFGQHTHSRIFAGETPTGHIRFICGQFWTSSFRGGTSSSGPSHPAAVLCPPGHSTGRQENGAMGQHSGWSSTDSPYSSHAGHHYPRFGCPHAIWCAPNECHGFDQIPATAWALAPPGSQSSLVQSEVAYPQGCCLATCHVCHLHSAHWCRTFAEARAGAFNALGGTKAGANPQIHLALTTSTITDPEFYALWQSVLHFRRHIHPDMLDLTLGPAAVVSAKKRKPGPGGVLLTRLEQICWTYLSDGQFQDGEGGRLHILSTPIQEMQWRLSRSWHHMVGRKWEFRKGFAGFRFVCPRLSKPALGLAADDQGFIRAAQNGTFYTNDQFVISGYVDTDACKFCGQPDSTSHRYWTCAASQPSRDLLNHEVAAAIPDLPPCTLQHGWATEPESVRDFKSALASIPDGCGLTLGDLPRSHLDLFCDGAGRDPAVPQARLVAWAVVLAGSDHTQCHRPISWGGVPGQWQQLWGRSSRHSCPPYRQGVELTKLELPLLYGVIRNSPSREPEQSRADVFMLPSSHQITTFGSRFPIWFRMRQFANCITSNPIRCTRLRRNGFSGLAQPMMQLTQQPHMLCRHCPHTFRLFSFAPPVTLPVWNWSFSRFMPIWFGWLNFPLPLHPNQSNHRFSKL